MAHNIPPATLAAGDRADPAWWLACAEFHEGWAEAAGATETEREYNSAAALACRTFAEMMERAHSHHKTEWAMDYDGEMFASGLYVCSLPAAAVAALTEGK